MRRRFINSLRILAGVLLASAVMFGLVVASPETSAVYNVAIGTLTTLICSSPLAIAYAIGTGVMALLENNNQEKAKRDFDGYELDDDTQLREIMRRLSVDQQDYLRERLRNARMGVGSDGELRSMSELLDNFEDEDRM